MQNIVRRVLPCYLAVGGRSNNNAISKGKIAGLDHATKYLGFSDSITVITLEVGNLLCIITIFKATV